MTKGKILKINYFSGGIGLNNIDQGKKIQPDEKYWKKRLGEVEVPFFTKIADLSKSESNQLQMAYWVQKKLYQEVELMCEHLGIDQKFADNLCIPLSHYEFAGASLEGESKLEVAKELKRLYELLDTLKHDRSGISKVIIEAYQDGTINVDDGRILKSGTKKFVFKKHSIVNLLTEWLKIEANAEGEPFGLIRTEAQLKGDGMSDFKRTSQERHDLEKMMYEYLQVNRLLKSDHDGCVKTGHFLSLVNAVPSKDDFDADRTRFASYDSYAEFIGDLVRKRLA